MESLLWMCQSNQRRMKLELSFAASQGHIAADEITPLSVGQKGPLGLVPPADTNIEVHGRSSLTLGSGDMAEIEGMGPIA